MNSSGREAVTLVEIPLFRQLVWQLPIKKAKRRKCSAEMQTILALCRGCSRLAEHKVICQGKSYANKGWKRWTEAIRSRIKQAVRISGLPFCFSLPQLPVKYRLRLVRVKCNLKIIYSFFRSSTLMYVSSIDMILSFAP